MSPYSKALMIHILYFIAQTVPFVSNSYVPSTLSHSKRDPDSTHTFSSSTLVVRQTNAQPGEFSTITAAVEALKDSKGPKKIFLSPGTYREQVHIKYKYPIRIQGYSEDPHSLSANRVTIEVAVGAADHGGENARSAAIWVQSPDFKMSNVNVVNSYGTGTDTQALALAAQGGNHDFIFGPGTAWFEMSDIVIKAPKHISTITAQKRASGASSIFIFNKSKVIPMDTSTPDHSTYLGRPWSSHAAVTFQSCYLSDVVHPAGWIQWGSQDPRTDHIQFEEVGNYGPGANTKDRDLGSTRSQPRSIEDVLGSEFKTWADDDSI